MSYTVMDISKFNTVTNYSTAADQLNGVLIRCGYRGYGSSGTLVKDSMFSTHYNGFVNTAVKIGVYWVTQALNTTEAAAEADYVCSMISGLRIDFPIYLDIELGNSSATGRADKLSKSVRTANAIAFCERVKAYGYRGGIYTSDSWYNANLDYATLYNAGYSIWVAKYSTKSPIYATNYDAWQYTSSATVSGVSGNVDLSHFYVDVAGWETTVKKQVSDYVTGLTKTSFVYTGSKPTITFDYLYHKDGITSSDVSISYSDSADVGTYTLTVTGQGTFEGSVSFNYSITAQSISGKTISLSQDTYVYDGNQKKPTVSVSGLTSGTDFTVSYQNNINVGQATATATGINNYTGSIYKVFYITTNNLADFKVTLSQYSYSYDGSAKTPTVTVEGLSSSYYTVTYQNNTNAGVGYAIVTGKNGYTGTNKVSFSINAKSIVGMELVIDADTYKYTGSAITPIGTVGNLVLNTDYKLSYSNNINVGQATITASGINNYCGSISKNFYISTYSVANFEITLSYTHITYNGKVQQPTISVKTDLGKTLSTSDYEVTYPSDCISAGTKPIIVSGIGRYSGIKTVYFTIDQASILNMTLNLECYYYKYNSRQITPKAWIDYLEEGTEYTITYGENIIVGTGTVAATGIGNYCGSISTSFVIDYRPIDECIAKFGTPTLKSYFRVRPASGSYNEIKIYTDEEDYKSNDPLIEDEDYSITDYSESIIITDDYNFSLAAFIVKGLKYFSGSVTYRFRIIDKEPSYEIDYTDDLVYNFGDIDDGDETADGDYDFDDIDDEVTVVLAASNGGKVLPGENYDFDLFSTMYLDTYDEDTGTNVDSRGNAERQDPINPIIDDDDGVYNFGDIDEGDETAEGDYDFGDLDEGVEEGSVADGDYDFNDMAGDGDDRFYVGEEFELNNTPIYATYESKTSACIRSGKYYIYHTKIMNNRIRLTLLEDGTEKPCRSSGWVDIVELLRLTSIQVGDIVTVNGLLYEYSNGGLLTSIKDRQMYVTDIVDGAEYPYAISSTRLSTRLGFVDADSLEKVVVV